jgi:crotonobetainyl-CoA:carnitine CoA-transferase CaiB-like acyl-CoA transferase
VAADPQAEAAGCFVEMADGKGGVVRLPATPARFPGIAETVRAPAPTLGQHTAEVLAGLGYSAAEIAALMAGGAAA